MSSPEHDDHEQQLTREALLQELSRKRPRQSKVTSLYTYLPSRDIPSAYRLKLWQSLLGVDPMSQALLEQRINGVALDLPNQRVVRMDTQRTRADLPLFRCDTMRERIQNILTYYCKNREVEYKQGMNEVLAPVMIAAALEKKCQKEQVDEVFGDIVDDKMQTVDYEEAESLMSSVSNAIVYQVMERILAKFLSRIFGTDDEFISLQCSLRLFRLLLQYHAPDICVFLDQYDLLPELYATPWFFTLFAHTLDPNLLLPLWDFLIFHSTGRSNMGSRTLSDSATANAQEGQNSPCGPEILHFIAVAFVISNRNEILHCQQHYDERGPAELPMILRNLHFKNRKHLRSVCRDAVHLYMATPVTYRKQLYDICYGSTGTSQAVLERLESRICVKITVDELLEAEAKRGASAAQVDNSDVLQSPQFFIVDCRHTKEFKQGHLPTCFHFDPHTFEDAERLEDTILQFEGLKGLHIAILGSGDSSKTYSRPSKSANPYKLGEEEYDDSPTVDNAELGVEDSPAEDYTQEHDSGKKSLMDKAKRMRNRMKNRRRKKSSHELVTTSANEDDDYSADDLTRHLVLFFLQRGFPYVSEVQGGYTALHQHQSTAVNNVLISTVDEDTKPVTNKKNDASRKGDQPKRARARSIQERVSSALKNAVSDMSRGPPPVAVSSTYTSSMQYSDPENSVDFPSEEGEHSHQDREQLIRVWMYSQGDYPSNQVNEYRNRQGSRGSVDSQGTLRSSTAGSTASLHEVRKSAATRHKLEETAKVKSSKTQSGAATNVQLVHSRFSNEEMLLDAQLDEIESLSGV
eukprot:gb/GECG01016687.1/.p1 GENE.gb/GECG01016687.1/~~gb/GECG01016687.1/.p1  ORF type:complete len:804 (+),score=104.71 gb/GECG01016687.1/:1-2412(+)